MEDFQGPLAGIQRALDHATTEGVLIVSCDTPLLPMNLVERLMQALTPDKDIAIACDPERCHPVVALIPCALAPSLEEYLASGKRSVVGWQSTLRRAEVMFHEPYCFANANTQETLEELEKLLAG